MTNTKTVKRTISLLLALVLLLGAFPLSTSAATRGYEGKTGGIQVWTNKGGWTPYITLTQTPAKYDYKGLFGNQKTKDIYKNYLVTVKPICTVDGGKTNAKKIVKWLDSSSLKIKLEKGVYYEVSVQFTTVPVKLPGWSGSYRKGQSTTSWSLQKAYNCSNWK